MCYAKPGPRCTKHALNKLNTARGRVSKAKSALTIAENEAISNSYSSSSVKKLNRARVAYQDKVMAYNEADREYQSTPGGLEELDKAIVAAAKSGDRLKVDSLMRAREDAKNLRASQIRAYEAKKSGERTVAARGKVDKMTSVERIRFAGGKLNVEELKVLLGDEDHRVRAAAVSNPDLPPQILERAVYSRNAVLRAGAAANPNITATHVKLFEADFDERVRKALNSNPSYRKTVPLR